MKPTIHPAAERIIKFMNGKKKEKIGVQGISHAGQLIYMLLRNEKSGLIDVVYFHGSLVSMKKPLTDCDDDLLIAIAEGLSLPGAVNAFANIVNG